MIPEGRLWRSIVSSPTAFLELKYIGFEKAVSPCTTSSILVAVASVSVAGVLLLLELPKK